MRTIGSTLAVAILAGVLVTPAVHSQTTETQIPFDSAGRVRIMTPGLADRFGLRPPTWPVASPYVDARLYEGSGGALVIVASRGDGTLIRYPLTTEGRTAIARAIAASQTGTRNVRTDEPGNTEENSRGAFVRNQTLLTAIVYAPAAASLTTTTKARTAVWLLGTGGSFFALSALTRNAHITHPQNHLSTDGGLRGALITNGALHAFGVDLDDDAAVAAGLAGALGGAVVGYKLGKKLTDAEAHASTTWSTFAGLTALGVSAAFRAGGDSTSERAAIGATVGAGVVGYVLGPQYVRRSSYTVTPGDLGVMHVTAALGVGAATIPFWDAEPLNERTLAGALTAGMIVGLVAGDVFFTRPFDHSESEARRVGLGAIAGGLVGAAAAVLAEPSAGGGAAMVIGGATLGTFITDRLVKPLRARK